MLHQGYEYADCAEAAWISLSSMAEKIASNMIGTGMAVLRCIDRPIAVSVPAPPLFAAEGRREAIGPL